jgi:hypothetical protein
MEVGAAFALAQGVGTVLSTVSGIFQASSQASQDKELAKQRMAQARADEFASRRESDKLLAKQQAGAAAAGLEQSGTPLELQLDSAFNAELNALNIRKQGEYDAAFYKTRARRTKAQIPGLIFQGATSLAGQGFNFYKNKPKSSNPLAAFDNPFERGLP